ncbi:MAG: GIY-YIG nuclease family protein [Methylotenera sp.]|jgi:putative endonuclease
MKKPCIYILSNKMRGTLYVGVTSDLIGRVWQHKHDLVDGFSKKYQLHLLVYFEPAETMLAAITREKQLKKWNRTWKIELIETSNSAWRDLYIDLTS